LRVNEYSGGDDLIMLMMIIMRGDDQDGGDKGDGGIPTLQRTFRH